MIARRLSRLNAGALALGIAVLPVYAQYGSSTPEAQPNNYPPALPARRGPGPRLAFEKLGEIALPGPLAGGTAWFADGVVVIPVEGGVARVRPEAEAAAVLDPVAARPSPAAWLESRNGKRRYKTTPEGRVVAERRRRPGTPWRHSWRLVAPNSIVAPPVLLGPRLCYAGLDDCVTCVRASNGHRLWSVDLGDRLSIALTCWPACENGPDNGTVLLAVPDDGASVIALDAYDGRRVARFDLPANQRFATPALVLPGGRIAIARKGYDDREAALVLLRLAPPPPAAPAAPAESVPYNKQPAVQAGTSGR